ncbi:YbhB/YbcL family Raf kinase inhibitor-like protein [Candidatus Nanohalococcus occultus]|uniref:Phospholipid-binding protein n=1 Tax=Candidatus Nanohalococcus occultus TaxID=2978047 RepID=A0ABY8CHF2_9ARCH|nr:Phospholipid-binding protein [Candidatus Nanohaloarchaeota archaeon SVXNc]
MKLNAPELGDENELKEKHGYMGENVNPALQIEDVPEKANALALVFEDPDAQEMAGKTWLHWLVWNIPADTGRIESDESPGIEGTTDFKKTGYNGPNPPDGEHEVVFKLYALNEELDLQEEATLDEFEEAIGGKVVVKTELKAVYPYDHIVRD